MATACKVADATTNVINTRTLVERNETIPVVLQGQEPGARRTNSMLVASDSFEDLECCVEESSASGSAVTGCASGSVNDNDASSGGAPVFRDRVPSGPIDEITRLEGLALSNDAGPSIDCSNETIPRDDLTTETEPEGSQREQPVADRVSEVMTASIEDEEPDYVHSPAWRAHRKHVFILSSAGKPIYSRYGDEDRIVTMVGLMQALVSVVQASQDALRSIIVGRHKFVFLVREQLILVGVVSSAESCQQMFHQLTYVYSQLLSVLTHSQLVRIFKDRRNYDLRRMLTGAEKFFNNLLDLMDHDPSFLLGAVRCLPLDSSVRDIVAQSIAQHAKVKDLVFAILVAEGQLITLVRMKKFFLHPHDLHLIFNLIGASESFKSAESWTPICLPKFDSSGYLHAHISYLDEQCRICLLLLTVDRDVFFTLSDCKHKIEQRLRKYNCLNAISKAIDTSMTYRVSETDIAELRHFLYKSKSTAQFTSPEYEAPYTGAAEQAHIVGLYQFMHQRLHSAARPLKILYYVAAREALLGWTTNGFELYAVFGPLVTKNTAINSVNKLLKWIKKEEDRLFILNSPTF